MPGMDLTTHQARFHQRWPDLRDPHVRALAWLLYAPDLLAPEAACWDGRVATLGQLSPEVAGWLHDLQYDQAMNAALHAHLAQQPSGRLGRYAEKLLGFYLRQQDWLVAANLQVRNQRRLGRRWANSISWSDPPRRESDAGVVHWEFATKFYLLQARQLAATAQAMPSVGPNLADSLGRKMRKIMDQQLKLPNIRRAGGPAGARGRGARPGQGMAVLSAGCGAEPAPAMGIAAEHCRGFWCDAAALPGVDDGTTGYADLAAPVLVGAGSPASRAVHAAGATVGPVGRNVHG
jgi:hypothetical protein